MVTFADAGTGWDDGSDPADFSGVAFGSVELTRHSEDVMACGV